MSELNSQLFFKVWRNGLIKKKIRSFMVNQLKYEGLFIDQVVSVEWMCINGHIELLKEKVMENEYLVFQVNKEKKAAGTLEILQNEEQGLVQEQTLDLILWGREEDDIPQEESIRFTVDNSYNDPNGKYAVFKYIQHDMEFYTQLFKNYSKIFLENKQETLMYILKYDCIGALKVLGRKGSIGFKEKYLIKAILYESFQVAKFIYQNLLIKPSAKSIFLKTIHHNKVGTIRSSSIDKRVLFLVKELNLQVPNGLNRLQYSHNIVLLDCTIRDIYNSCYCLALLKKPLAKYAESRKKNLRNQEPWLFDSMYPSEVTRNYLLFGYTWLTLEYLENVEITKEQFNTKLIDLDLDLARSLQDLEALLRMVLPFIDVTSSSRYMVGFMYYNYVYRDAIRTKELLYHNYYDNVWLFQKTRLFSAISRINYVKTIAKHIKNQSPYTHIHRKYQRRVLNYFIQVNDYESIAEVSKIMLSCGTNLSNRVFVELKDNIELFDYFYDITPPQLFKFDYLLLNATSTILNHYKSKYIKDFRSRAESLDLKLIKKGPIGRSLVRFLYDNLEYFKVQFHSMIQMWRPFDSNPSLLDMTYQEFKFFFTRMDSIACLNYFGSHYNQFNSFEKYLLYKYYSYDLSNCVQLSSSSSSSSLNNSIDSEITLMDEIDSSDIINPLAEITPSLFLDNCKLVMFEIGKRGDTDTLDRIMVNYFPNEHSNIYHKYQLYNLLFVACHFGQIEIFKYLFSNHSWVLLNQYNDQSINIKSPNLLNKIKLSEIKSLLIDSRSNYYLYYYLIKYLK